MRVNERARRRIGQNTVKEERHDREHEPHDIEHAATIMITAAPRARANETITRACMTTRVPTPPFHGRRARSRFPFLGAHSDHQCHAQTVADDPCPITSHGLPGPVLHLAPVTANHHAPPASDRVHQHIRAASHEVHHNRQHAPPADVRHRPGITNTRAPETSHQ